MNSPWLSYVPYHVAEDIIANPEMSPIGRQRRFDVVALFADVSGFTAISEALGKSGKAGTEELTGILNSYFSPMIALVESYGGIIGKFGGDAMTILFPYTSKNQKVVAQRAVQCALDMQARMGDYAAIQTSAGPYGLAMKAGLALGSVLCTSVGDLEIRTEYIIAGKVLDDCADAEHHATKGEVVIHDALLPFLSEIELVERREGFTCLSGLKKKASKAPLKKSQHVPDKAISVLESYLHPAIAQRVRTDQSGFINEHRKVTALFVRFSGFDYDSDPYVARKLQAYLSAVIRTVHRYDGYLNKVDMGDKGSKYIVLFGAPVAHEDDEERALRCALELRSLPGAEVRIGVNTGFVYCGQVGSDARQEYTVMGDVVNLSARLMQAAEPGQILTSQFTQRYVEGLFDWGDLTRMQFKGKSELIPVCAVLGIQQAARVVLHAPLFNLPMVGRKNELFIAESKIQHAIHGSGQIIGVTAEAGMGKSRLAAEIVRIAGIQGITGYAGECQSFGTNISYLVWHTIWRDFFGLDANASPADQIEALSNTLRSLDANFVQRLPLLAPALNLSIPDNALTASLEPKLRSEMLEALLLDCLRIKADRAPILLVLEDCHWIDPLSFGLLNAIARNIADLPVLMLVLYRPLQTHENLLEILRRSPHFTEIALTEFTPEEASHLIELKLAQFFGTTGDISSDLISRITDRAQGNPFYIEELLNLIHDRGIDPRDSQALEALELPDSLNSLIISRIDQLAESEKLTLKVASVIGRVFKANWIWGSSPDIGAAEDIKRQLVNLSSMELTLQEKPEPELEYLFKHVLTQEVAYESLAYATRQTLHEQIAHYIEQQYDDSAYINLLAHHYGRSSNTDKQRHYFRLAGDRAKLTYANEAAIDYYQRLIPLLPEAEQPEIMRVLADVRELTGQWDTAEDLYRQALTLAEKYQVVREQAWCRSHLGHLLLYKASPADAQHWLERAREDFEQQRDHAGLSRTLKVLALTMLQQGQYDAALDFAWKQRRINEERGNQIGISEANMNIAWAYADRGQLEEALVYLRDALEISQRANHIYGMITANSDMAGIFFSQGNYAASIHACLQAYTLATQIGYLDGAGLVALNMGELYRQEGEYANALTCYTWSLAIRHQIGNVLGLFITLGSLAILRTAQAEYDLATPLFQKALQLGRTLNNPYWICEFLQQFAAALMAQKHLEEATSHNNEALEMAAQIERREVQFEAQMLAIKLERLQGKIDLAEAVKRFTALVNDESPEPERAAAYYAAWEMDNTQTKLREQAAALYRALYETTPTVEFYRRYQTLTGETLSAPPPLPPLPESITHNLPDLDSLLAQINI